jgi:hypothetical protein
VTVPAVPPAPAGNIDPETGPDVPDDPAELADSIAARTAAAADQVESSRGALAAARRRMEES